MIAATDDRPAENLPKPASERLVSVDELSNIFGLTPWTIRVQVKQGNLPHLWMGHRLLFLPSQVRARLEDLSLQSVRTPSVTTDASGIEAHSGGGDAA